jgi:O-antigen/teichoic acid export membrane protein
VVLGFGCGIITARMLGPHDRGALALLITTVGLCGFVSGLGSGVALRVDLMRDPRVQIRSYAELSICLALLQAAVVAGAVLLLGGLVGLDRQHMRPMMIGGVLLGVTCFAAQQMLEAINAIGRPSSSALLNSIGSLATLVVLLITWRSHLGLLAAVTAYAVGFVVVAVAGWKVCTQPGTRVPVANPEVRSHLQLVRRGMPLLGLNLGQALAFKLDHYFVGAFAGVAATGTYSVAAAHVAPSQVASNSIGQVAFRDAAHDELSNAKLTWMVLAAGSVAGGCAIVLWVVAPWFIPFVFGQAFQDSVPLIRILMIGQIVLAPYLVLSRAFAGRGSALLSSGSGILLLVLLCGSLAVLTPPFGAIGAAWASVITFGGSSLVLALALRTKIGQSRRHQSVTAG